MWRLAATFVLATGEPVDAAGDAVDPEEVEPIQPDIVAMERAGFKAFMAQPDVVRPFLQDMEFRLSCVREHCEKEMTACIDKSPGCKAKFDCLQSASEEMLLSMRNNDTDGTALDVQTKCTKLFGEGNDDHSAIVERCLNQHGCSAPAAGPFGRLVLSKEEERAHKNGKVTGQMRKDQEASDHSALPSSLLETSAHGDDDEDDGDDGDDDDTLREAVEKATEAPDLGSLPPSSLHEAVAKATQARTLRSLASKAALVHQRRAFLDDVTDAAQQSAGHLSAAEDPAQPGEVGLAHLSDARSQLEALQRGLSKNMAQLATLSGKPAEDPTAEQSQGALEAFFRTLATDKAAAEQAEQAPQVRTLDASSGSMVETESAPAEELPADMGTSSLVEDLPADAEAGTEPHGFSEHDAYRRLQERSPHLQEGNEDAFRKAFEKGQALERRKLQKWEHLASAPHLRQTE